MHCEVAPAHTLYAANASLVRLCFLNEKSSGRGGPVLLSQTPVCPCVGFAGVLWGVDMACGLYTCCSLSPPSGQRSSAGCCHTDQHPPHRTDRNCVRASLRHNRLQLLANRSWEDSRLQGACKT
ncbi:unnamed protein product [Oncorhynchus mykiss]|uniref:Uncharacterized protein n=1 Tax=Oncorhynchus mykiss TaxID=8022 RepID=A0A060X5J4_ONCMY|nr:unnamed protein product [Oncorhynchus mykiss]